MTHRGIPHRAAGMPPVRPADMHVYPAIPAGRCVTIARWPWYSLDYGRWYTHETGPLLPRAGDRIIPAPRIPPTGGWGHR